MSAEHDLAKAIADAVDAKVAAMRPESSTMPATYQGTDSEGKGWVLLPGATEPTPISRMAVEAAQGDMVSVTVANGKATVGSNVSNPSAGLAGVKVVEKTANVAKQTATQAIDYASAAQSAAVVAKQGADTAFVKAEEATASAEVAHAAATAASADAAIARQSAESAIVDAAAAGEAASAAQASASDANARAIAAGIALSEVESVVGTVNWIAEHGDYTLTDDAEIIEGKPYYTRGGDDPDYVYTLVTDPQADDLSTYYELSLDESVQNYIASHLWLDDYGLNLTVDTSSGYRLHEGTVDGTRPLGMYVLDETGVPVSAFGETVRIGAETGANVRISGDRMSFLVGDTEVAYVAIDADTNESTFYMTKAVIVQDLRFGDWQWRKRDNRNLSLRWIGGEV